MRTVDSRLSFAIALAQEAGALAMDFYARRAELSWETKGRNDLVSVADRTVENMIRSRIAATFPHDAFLGEESGGGGRSACWVVDPIDGTTNFLRGLPLWGVSIAYAVDAVPCLAVIHLPALKQIYSAAACCGAYAGARRLLVSSANTIAGAVVSIGQAHPERARPSGPAMTEVENLGGSLRSLGSCVAELAAVADGGLDGFAHPHLQPWDYYAGLLIVAEAGGRTNAPFGPARLQTGAPVIASSSNLYADFAASLPAHWRG